MEHPTTDDSANPTLEVLSTEVQCEVIDTRSPPYARWGNDARKQIQMVNRVVFVRGDVHPLLCSQMLDVIDEH